VPRWAPLGTPRVDRAASSRLPQATARIVLPALAGGVLVAILALYFQRGFIPGDAIVYLAAGERLNAGHQLYALLPGDRLIDLKPPYWTVPLLSPPFIGVLFRPLALLPGDVGAYVWWAGCIIAIGTVLVALVRRAPVAASLVVLMLAIPIVYEIGVGNVNGLLLGGAIATWILGRKGRSEMAGPIAAVMIAVKLTPLPIGAWVVGVGRRRGLAAVTVSLTVAAVVSVAGAGFPAHADYLSVLNATNGVGIWQLSPGGIAVALGLPAPIPTLLQTGILVAGTILAAVLPARGHPAAGFTIAVVAWTFGSPVVNINTPVLLLALLAPLAWPWPGERRNAGQTVAAQRALP